jgi:hypothetical protein
MRKIGILAVLALLVTTLAVVPALAQNKPGAHEQKKTPSPARPMERG